MTPPHVHIRIDELLSAGKLFTKTVGEPGVHGAAVTGIHGAGIVPPTVDGLAGHIHEPNGRMFAIGLLSMILAIGILVITVPGGFIRVDGATPKAHLTIAPAQTHIPIVNLRQLFRNY